MYWATISYSSPSVSHSNSSISAPYFLQRAHVLGFVEEAGGPDFIVNLNAVGEEPSVRGVKQHFAAQQCFEAPLRKLMKTLCLHMLEAMSLPRLKNQAPRQQHRSDDYRIERRH